ncbi:HEPN domain-containing protein [Laspinema sp. D1]|uniref:HEPN domain-containing protein n=2 Tax=Laspinema TaxID=2584823 RepID=A0ABT2MSE0_9CYAN|nr:HEPN domain-containing protein [Laspinema sp. D2b]MCT7967676.1 HEPN domain-containing protein [Laspinema sp. D2a]
MRLKEVEVLLNNRQYSGAYYLSGYVIECALKACIARKTRKFDFPDKKTVLDSYTHDLQKLVTAAQLDNDFKVQRNNPDFYSRWLRVKEWTEESRYQKHSKSKALEMYEAIKDPNHGVLQWLQQHW